MALKLPSSMQDCLYFTNREYILAWVYKKECPQCHKAQMGKPVEKGKVKIRAKEYICPSCGYTQEQQAYEESLNLEAQYTCPSCHKKGESTAPYKRKVFQGIPSYVVECQHCGTKMPLTKKLKKAKGKEKLVEEDY